VSGTEKAFLREAVLERRDLGRSGRAPALFELLISWAGPAPRPGQFFMLRAERSAFLLGRPISVLGAAPGTLSFAIAERGGGTAELGGLRAGDGILLEGPLGSAWPASGDIPGSGPLALIGGGIGLAPLLFLAAGLPHNAYILFAGYRSEPWGLEALPADRLRVFTEDGSAGRKGRVLEGFEAAPHSALLACGPRPMLRSVAALSAASGVPAWLSLEKRMACGVGACLGCSVRTREGRRRACVEGPVFRAEELVWEGGVDE